MKEIVHNRDNLTMNDINDHVYRSRGIIVNSKNEILLGKCSGIYQFPGGHLEGEETMLECLKREVKEETGIDIGNYNEEPFFKVRYLTKNYPNEGNNRYTEFNYYRILTDELFDLKNVNYDDYEKENHYKLEYVSLDDFDRVLDETVNENARNEHLYKELKKVIREYKEIF